MGSSPLGLVGAERNRYLFSGETPPVPNPAEAHALVDFFLRGFAPDSQDSRS